MEEDNSQSSNSDVSDNDVTGGAHACPGLPISYAGDSGASTSAASDHEFCPPLSVEHTADSDSQSSLGSLPLSGTTKLTSLSKCKSHSSAANEPESLSGNKTITEENIQVKKKKKVLFLFVARFVCFSLSLHK